MADYRGTQDIPSLKDLKVPVSEVLERVYQALVEKGYNPVNQLVGYIMSGDPTYITSYGGARAMKMAMKHAGVAPEQISYINAHGTSTELNDKFETMAIKKVFGDAAYKVAVSSTKGTTGHALGAAGGLESIACIKAIETGIVPPTINYETPDPLCDLDITPNKAVKRDIKTALNMNLGFGGHNAAVIFRKYEN